MPEPMFKKAEGVAAHKKDDRGKVVIKIMLQDPRKPDFPVTGNRKEVIVLEDATVGEVVDAINKALGF